MQCNSCGAANRDDAQFCRNCGQPLFAPPASVTEAPTAPLPPSAPTYQPPFSEPTNTPPAYTAYLSQNTPPGPLSNPGYGQPGYRPPLPNGASGRAVTSLVLGILSWFTCGPVLSIPAMILGKMEMNAIRDGRASAAGLGYAKAGFWIGLIMTLFSCVGGLLALGFGALGAFMEAIR